MIKNFKKQDINRLCKVIYKQEPEDKTIKFELGEIIPEVSITM